MQVGNLIKNGNNTGVVVKIYGGTVGGLYSELIEIRWLKTNSVTRLTKRIMDLYGMEVICEDR